MQKVQFKKKKYFFNLNSLVSDFIVYKGFFKMTATEAECQFPVGYKSQMLENHNTQT